MRPTVFQAASVLLIDPDPFRRRRLASLIEAEETLSLLAARSQLFEVYNITEQEQPDLVIIAAEVTHVPEFPMYRSLLAILGRG